MHSRRIYVAGFIAAALPIVLSPAIQRVAAHCDTLDGPLVSEAREALESGEVTPVLKWVRPEDETLIRDSFAHTLAVRDEGDDIRRLADQLFLETLVRVHRQSEGAPYTGLKPAGSTPPIFVAADTALEGGTVDELADRLAAAVRREVTERFETVLERRAHVDESVEAGREYVEAYVIYMHFVEGVHEFVNAGGVDTHFAPETDQREAH